MLELLREAQKVYVRREDETQKRHTSRNKRTAEGKATQRTAERGGRMRGCLRKIGGVRGSICWGLKNELSP